MSVGAVVAYDLSGQAGYAIYHPDFHEPRYGHVRLPQTTANGSVGPACKLLFEHITWVANNFGPIVGMGYEQFIAATGGRKDDETSFVTSPAAQKKLIGLIATFEMAAAMLGVEAVSIHNASWRKYWLGSKPRGTDRKEWKRLSVLKANGLGWPVKNDDEADALGQLHFLMRKLEIPIRWGRNPSPDLIMAGLHHGVPINA